MKLLKKIIPVLTPFSLLILSVSSATADIYVMKNGIEINGTIISETADTYLLRAEVSNNVYAEKEILKSKLREIIKVDPSIAAYEKLTSILPTPDLMPAHRYEALLKSRIESFLKEYPASPHYADVEKIQDTLKKEYHVIKSGGLKVDGKLHTPQQIEANKYDVQASVLLNDFMTYAQQKQYRAALSTLTRMEKAYPNTIQTRKAQKVALIILPLYEEKLQQLLENVDILIEKRRRALDSMTTSDSSRTKKIFAYEERQYQNLLSLAKANNNKTKWLPINQYFKEPIQNNLNLVDSEIKRINIASQMPASNVGELYRETYNALGSGDYEKAKESFENFKRSSPPIELVNELEPRIQDAKSVMERLEQQRIEAEILAEKEAKEELARLAKEKKDAAKALRENNAGDGKENVLDTIKKKKEMEDKLSQ